MNTQTRTRLVQTDGFGAFNIMITQMRATSVDTIHLMMTQVRDLHGMWKLISKNLTGNVQARFVAVNPDSTEIWEFSITEEVDNDS